jgi:hypothetical protein
MDVVLELGRANESSVSDLKKGDGVGSTVTPAACKPYIDIPAFEASGLFMTASFVPSWES